MQSRPSVVRRQEITYGEVVWLFLVTFLFLP